MIGIGLLGAGRIGQLHARNIVQSSKAKLVAVFDADHRSAAALAESASCVVATSSDEIFDTSSIDAIFICSPTDTHVSMIERATVAGKAVFCEKPIDIEMSSAIRVVEALEKNPVPFMTGFHRRFDESTKRLRQHITSGRLGDAEFMRVMSRDPAPPPIEYIRRTGGIFRDMTIHDLDLCRWLSGQEFTSVFARGFDLIDPRIAAAGDNDTAFITLWNESGFSCVIQNSRRSNGGFDQRIEIMGSRASARMENVPLSQTSLVASEGTQSDALPDHFPQRYRDAYVAELDEFLSALVEKRTPITSAEDGLAALQLADACDQSARTGRAVTIEPLARNRSREASGKRASVRGA